MGARGIGGVFSVKREASVGVRRDTHLLCHAWLRLAFSEATTAHCLLAAVLRASTPRAAAPRSVLSCFLLAHLAPTSLARLRAWCCAPWTCVCVRVYVLGTGGCPDSGEEQRRLLGLRLAEQVAACRHMGRDPVSSGPDLAQMGSSLRAGIGGWGCVSPHHCRLSFRGLHPSTS